MFDKGTVAPRTRLDWAESGKLDRPWWFLGSQMIKRFLTLSPFVNVI